MPDGKEKIGVVGAGAMGRGIVQLFAQAGHDVYFYDAVEGAVSKAQSFVEDMVRRAAEKGRISHTTAAAVKARLIPCQGLDELAECDIVIEAVIENLEIKRKLFRELEAAVSPTAILASNTSSLVIADIAAGCQRTERVAGLHFFNPVPLMKVAEVVSAVRTSETTVNTLKKVVELAGHRAVIAADQPGFLVNHAGRGLYTEGLRILEEQVAGHADIDRVLREAAGFRMGPFELMDLVGLDVSGKVMESIYGQFHQEPRFRPSPLVSPRVAAGLLGRKTGEGWYRYEGNEGNREPDDRQEKTYGLPEKLSVWIDPGANQAGELKEIVSATAATPVPEPLEDALLIIQPWGIDAAEACARNRLDPTRTVAIDPLPGLDKHRTLMLTPVTSALMRDAAAALFGAQDVPATVINDSHGFILQRVLASIVNVGANIVQGGIATVADLEDSVKLGLGYPHGPLSWGDQVGGERILTVLQNIHEITGDPRYRPSQWLRRRVRLGLPLVTEEAQR